MVMLAFFSPAKKRSDEPSGVLFISSGGLGDTVLLSLILDRLCQIAELDESITLILRHDAAKMAFLFGDRIDILPVDYTAFRKDRSYRKVTSDQLYKANYRLVVSTDYLRHPKLDDAFVKACAAPEALAMEPRAWVKYDKELTKNRALYSRLFDSGPVHLDKVLRWLRFADWLTGTEQALPLVQLPKGRVKPGNAFTRPTVILVPFSAVKEKQSPPELFEQIIAYLGDEFDFIITGAPDDLDANLDFKPLLERPNVEFDSAVFEALVPKLKQAHLVVSVDTATMHLAVAVGAPVVCLASAAYVGEIVPYAPEIKPENVRFIYTPMDCEGCLGNCDLPIEKGMFPCVAGLQETQILVAIDEVLAT
jgi:hypothetical protein